MFNRKKYLKLDKHIHICEKCSKNYSMVSLNICKNCNNEFFARTNRRNYCNNCLKKPKCFTCGKIINILILNDDNTPKFCSNKCSNINKSNINIKPGNCIICGKFNESRDALGQGKICGCLKIIYSIKKKMIGNKENV